MKASRSIARSGTAFEAFSSHAELYAMGKKLREKRPLESHAIWRPSRNRHNPLHLLEESNKGGHDQRLHGQERPVRRSYR